MFNCSGTKFTAIIVNVLDFMQVFLLDGFCALFLERFLTSQVAFSRFRASFLSDL